MTKKNTNNVHVNGRKDFLQQFIKHPLQVGSIIPSSRFLERRIIDSAGVGTARVIIELGPGTGGTTRAILNAMPSDARLVSIEINPHFYTMISRIEDERFIPCFGSATDIETVLETYELDSPDVVISGIPFSTMNRELGTRIIKTISTVLAPQGRFVAYQARDRVAELCRPIMGSEQSVKEFLNIPPMSVYQWEKRISEQTPA